MTVVRPLDWPNIAAQITCFPHVHLVGLQTNWRASDIFTPINCKNLQFRKHPVFRVGIKICCVHIGLIIFRRICKMKRIRWMRLCCFASVLAAPGLLGRGGPISPRLTASQLRARQVRIVPALPRQPIRRHGAFPLKQGESGWYLPAYLHVNGCC